MADAQPDPHLVPRIEALRLDSDAEEASQPMYHADGRASSPTPSIASTTFVDLVGDEDEFIEDPTSHQQPNQHACPQALSDTSSYVLASWNQTPWSGSDFEHISNAMSEDEWSRPDSISRHGRGETPIEDARAQLSHLELCERLRAAAIAQGETSIAHEDFVARSSASSPPPSDTTELVNLIPSTSLTSRRETPAHRDTNHQPASDGRHLGRMDEDGDPGSRTPTTFDDVPQELKDELTTFQHQRMAENGLLRKEELSMNPEMFLSDEDAEHIEELLLSGSTVEQIRAPSILPPESLLTSRAAEKAQQNRYAELTPSASTAAGSQSSEPTELSPLFGFYQLQEARHLQQTYDNPWAITMNASDLEAVKASDNLPTWRHRSESEMEDWDASDKDKPTWGSDATLWSRWEDAAADASDAETPASTSGDTWRHGRTCMLHPPDPEYRLLWHSHKAPLTAAEFVRSMPPSRTPGDTLFVSAPGSPHPYPSRHGFLPSDSYTSGQIDSSKRLYVDTVRQILALRVCLPGTADKGLETVAWSDAGLASELISKAESVILTLAKMVECYSGAFVSRTTTETVDAVWSKLVDSLCSPSGVLRRDSKIHTMSVCAAPTRLEDRQRTTSTTREYRISAFVSNVFDNSDVEQHRRLLANDLGISVDGVLPDVWGLLGFQSGRSLKLGLKVRLPWVHESP